MKGPFLAVDWGTSNRRVFRIEDGAVVATERDDRGAAEVAAGDYAAEVAGLRDRLGDLPMLLAGMVGSTIGWRTVPYVAAPARLESLVDGIDWIDRRTGIVPGVSVRDSTQADVMRGEEVQLLGAVAAGTVPSTALLCQPGTHCKWAWIEDRAITRFTTAMTGELFALLRESSLLAPLLAGDVAVGSAFLAGVGDGARRDLPASLFAIRARSVLGMGDDDAASYASGLLIGADVAARIERGNAVHILADAPHDALYAAAVEQFGGVPHAVGSRASFVAGISRLWELCI